MEDDCCFSGVEAWETVVACDGRTVGRLDVLPREGREAWREDAVRGVR